MTKVLTEFAVVDATLPTSPPSLNQVAALDARTGMGSVVVESVMFFDLDTNTNTFNFPGKWGNAGPRRRLVIQNHSANTMLVQFKNADNTDYNAPSWTGAVSIAANQQYETTDQSLTFFIRPNTSAQAINGVIYTTVGSL